MKSPESFKLWAIASRQDSLARRKSARLTEGSDSSRWPSARAEDSESCGNHPGSMDSLTGAARNWHTPSTEDHKSDGPQSLRRYGTPEMTTDDQRLRVQSAAWKTPHGFQNTDKNGKTAGGGAKQVMNWRTPDSPGSGGPRNREASIGKGHQTTIAEQAEQWPTPEAHFNKRGPGFAATDSHYKPHDLATAVDQWPTPQERDHRSGITGAITKKNARPLSEMAFRFSLPARPILKHGPGCSCSSRMLNPRFVELLMNAPSGWTEAGHPLASHAFAHWEMASCRLLRDMRTSRCAMPLPIAA